MWGEIGKIFYIFILDPKLFYSSIWDHATKQLNIMSTNVTVKYSESATP